MDLIHREDLLQSIKGKHLLLDTNVFIDAFAHPKVFGDFFNELKSNDNVVVTLESVKIEFLTGSSNIEKYTQREEYMDKIIDAYLPITPDTLTKAFQLITELGIDGSSISVTDYQLGSCLKKYKKNICLITKNTSDFPQRVFSVLGVVNFPFNKGIQTYGFYYYEQSH